MKFIQFYDADDIAGITACCTAAYSAKKQGNLGEFEFVIYNANFEKLRQIPLVLGVFDRIEPIPEDAKQILDNLPSHCESVKNNRRTLACWTKLLCFLFTLGDVILTDYDTLCLGSIREIIPTGEKIFSGRKAGFEKRAKFFNGGVLAKSALFDNSGARDIMLQALLDKESFDFSAKNCPYEDEAASFWLIHEIGLDKINVLDNKFNMLAKWHINKHKTLEQRDIRILHYNNREKPWLKCPAKYKHIKRRWESAKEEMIKDVLQRR